MAEKVIYEKRGRIAHVTINRPEAKNAIDPEVHARMIEVWEDLMNPWDRAVRERELRAAGQKTVYRY